MAKKIICRLQPFLMEQDIYVYENGNKLDATKATSQDLINTIISLADRYNIKSIDFSGPAQYSRGIGNQLQEASLVKYNQKFSINYIN